MKRRRRRAFLFSTGHVSWKFCLSFVDRPFSPWNFTFLSMIFFAKLVSALTSYLEGQNEWVFLLNTDVFSRLYSRQSVPSGFCVSVWVCSDSWVFCGYKTKLKLVWYKASVDTLHPGYVCNICRSVFYSRSGLTYHMWSHNKDSFDKSPTAAICR